MILTEKTIRIKFKYQFAIYMQTGEIYYIPEGKEIHSAIEKMVAYSEKGTIEIIEFKDINYLVVDGKKYNVELPQVKKLTSWQKINKFFKKSQ